MTGSMGRIYHVKCFGFCAGYFAAGSGCSHFYFAGITVGLKKGIQSLRDNGWTVEKPDTIISEAHDDA